LKILKYGIVFVMALVIFYVGAILIGFKLPGSEIIKEEGIAGEAVLEVKLMMDNTAQDPLANVEIDVAEKPGPPPEGGVGLTDERGIAVFRIKPGSYVVYFNQTNFPGNLRDPGAQPVVVTEEGPNQMTIQISTAAE